METFSTYHDEQADGSLIRVFDESVDPIELQWHRDGEDRWVVAVDSTDWRIQLDDQLPQSLNSEVMIPKGEWHRVIKGSGPLRIKITKGR